MNPDHLYNYVIEPTLRHIGLFSEAAAELVLGTALQESNGDYLKQIGGGPAVGIYQMEPATYDDIWKNYLVYKPILTREILSLELPRFAKGASEMIGNLYYATAMCRVHYYRRPEALPPAGNVKKQAAYWKAHYNTRLGHGTIDQYINNWKRLRHAG